MKEVDGSATWHGIVFDITRRKEAEERLLESENRYTLLFRKSIIPVVLMKLPEVVIADVNEAAENLTGFSRNEMIGRNSAELGLIDLSMRRKVIDDFSNKKNISGFEAKIKTKNGDERVIIINTNPLEINKQPYAITSMHDITERVRAEERLRDSEIRFHSIFHYSPVAIGISRWSDQKIININAAFTNLFGYTPEEAIGRTTAELGIWAELSERSSFFERIKKEERILSLEIPIVLKSGQKRQCMAWVEKTELNGELCIIAQMIDITEQKSAQEELRKSKEKAEESDRLKSHFLANISHEIRTPMNGILGFSDILRTMNPSGEEREKFFSLIQLSGERLMNTINDLIEISSIQAGAAVLSQTIVNINEIIRFHNDFFQSQAQEKGLFLTCHLPLSDARAYIRTDEKKLDSILTNLIRNAIKFTVKGSVEFGYRIQGKEIEFFVRDTGIGIPADRLEVIFDRFIQADLEITRAYEGTGLGLAIAKSYSEMLGGKLRVDSQENSGSTFWFSMPWVEEVMEYQEMPGPGIPFAFDLLHAYTLLIVEDDEVNCQYLLNILKPVFKSVFLAITGNEALSLCSREKTIDVILMDLKMPGMSGYETTRRIREFNKDVVIIAQTAHASKEEISKALESGCDDYITKPYYPEDLALVITRNMKKKLVQDEPLAG
jgi:PAS domain S-box-containing protein